MRSLASCYAVLLAGGCVAESTTGTGTQVPPALVATSSAGPVLGDAASIEIQPTHSNDVLLLFVSTASDGYPAAITSATLETGETFRGVGRIETPGCGRAAELWDVTAVASDAKAAAIHFSVPTTAFAVLLEFERLDDFPKRGLDEIAFPTGTEAVAPRLPADPATLVVSSAITCGTLVDMTATDFTNATMHAESGLVYRIVDTQGEYGGAWSQTYARWSAMSYSFTSEL